MMKRSAILLAAAATGLGACQDTTYDGGAPKLIARPYDSLSGDASGPKDGEAARAVLPDGCEAWIIDDGLEGYASNRSDPRTGLPRCDSPLPRGAVVGEWRTSPDLPDRLPR